MSSDAPENEMVDNPEQRQDRKDQAGGGRAEYRPPNRKTRRLIAKQRGVFKHPGAWPYVNKRSINDVNKHNKGDHDHETQE